MRFILVSVQFRAYGEFNWQFFRINTLASATALLIYVPLWKSRHIHGSKADETRISADKCLMGKSGWFPFISDSCSLRKDLSDLRTFVVSDA